MDDNGSTVSDNVSHILCHSFNISQTSNMYQVFMKYILEKTDVGIDWELIVASIIKDLLHMRDTHDKFFTKNQNQFMLDFFIFKTYI